MAPSHEVIVCGNCEESSADVQCTSCKGEDSFFCNTCWQVHVKVKQFRDHHNVNLTATSMCHNCDVTEATLRCTQCDAPSNLFCADCSLVHSRVKAFRSHLMESLDGTRCSAGQRKAKKKLLVPVKPLEVSVSEDMASSVLDRCFSTFLRLAEFLNLSFTDTSRAEGSISNSQATNWIVESINDITSSRDMDMRTIIFGFTVAFLVHLLVKFLLGKNSIFVIIAVGMFGVRWLRRKQNVVVTELNALKSENSEIFSEMKRSRGAQPEDFKHIRASEEFWHSSEESEGSDQGINDMGWAGMGRGMGGGATSPPHFRPRGKLYRRRGAGGGTCE